jgi:AraC-like DNA-binding protein
MDNIANNREFSCILKSSAISSEMGIEILSLGRLYDKSAYYCRDRVRDDYLLLLTLDGEAWVSEEKRRKTLDKGSWFLLRPGIIHSYRDFMPWSFAYMHFRGNVVNRVLESLAFFKRENLGFKQSNLSAENLLTRLTAKAPDVSIQGEVLRNSLLLEMLASLHLNYRKNKFHIDPLIAVQEYIVEHLAEDMSLPFLAKQAGISRFHFIRNFKQKYGYSPIHYIQKLRIEKAQSLLLHESPSMRIYEIAEAVGVKDPLYFSRTFKQRVGMSPEKFRIYAKQHFDLF